MKNVYSEDRAFFHCVFACLINTEDGPFEKQYTAIVYDLHDKESIIIMARENHYSVEVLDNADPVIVQMATEYFNKEALIREGDFNTIDCVNGGSGIVEEMMMNEKYGRQVYGADTEIELDENGYMISYCG